MPGCATGSRENLKGKQKKKKKIIILVYWDLQQEVLLSSRELSLLKKTWNENSERERKFLLQSTGGALHDIAEQRESSRLCQSEWEWGNGIRAAVENPGWIIKAPCSGMEHSGTSPWKR